MIRVYTDGSCYNKSGRNTAGYSAVICDGNLKRIFTGTEKNSTSNRAELFGVITGLAQIPANSTVEVYTDSQYVQRGITDYIWRWLDNGWKTTTGKPVKNKDLWIILYYAVQAHKVEFKWVKGHSGNPMNELADRTAREAAGYAP